MQKVVYPYLKDTSFLLEVDKMTNREQLIKITVLDLNENPIQSIEGRVTGGNININAGSAIRRTGSLNMVADENNNDLTNVENLFYFNKKASVEIGIKNNLDKYLDYPILWFPLGVYVFSTVSLSRSTSGVSLSLNLSDKMVMLNGEMGGSIPSIVEFDNINGEKIPFYNIIFELVHHWGKEQPGKIIIDVPDFIQQVIHVSVDEENIERHYRLIAAVPTQEIKSNIGDSVMTILDKLKGELGNYEYFYDIYGNFHFQEIKNYLNTSYSTQLLEDMKPFNLNIEEFIIDQTKGKTIYDFTNSNSITTYSNNPSYKDIKNEFIIWGKRNGNDGLAIRYRLAIDSKPLGSMHENIVLYQDMVEVEEENVLVNKPEGDIKAAVYGGEVSDINALKAGYITKCENKYYIQSGWDEIFLKPIFSEVYIVQEPGNYLVDENDWRTELYIQGIKSMVDGTETNRYFDDLYVEWPRIYDLQTKTMKKENPYYYGYYLDIIDTISDLSIDAIGARTYAKNEDKVNCVFMEDMTNAKYYVLNMQEKEWAEQAGYTNIVDLTGVAEEDFPTIITADTQREAYSYARSALYEKAQWNTAISIASLPIYYLEPNNLITVNDSVSGIHGDYLINSISLPLDLSGTMTLSCSKVLDKM